MLRWKKRRREGLDDGTDTLSRLLDSEQDLAARLEKAKAGAEDILRQARDYATQSEAACASLIQSRTGGLAASSEQELHNELQRIQSDTARDLARFDQADAGRIGKLAALVLESVVTFDGDTLPEVDG